MATCQMENNTLQPPSKPAKITKNYYEKIAWGNQELICGVDEVGRGCLAGPLVTAAVILHPTKLSPLLKDSKILSKEQLLKGYAWIIRHSWYGYGIVSHRQIDTHNIYQATLLAMKRAVMQAFSACPRPPKTIVVDAMPLALTFNNNPTLAIFSFPKGESLSSSIAAASIIAKVKRDSLISRFDPLIPGYTFAEHKGYATAAHRAALKHEGKSLIHRLSFLNNILPNPDHDHENQSNLF